MRHIRTIENCKKFSISKSGILIYLSNESIIYENNILKDSYLDFRVVENILYTYNSSINKTQFFDIENNKLIYENDDLVWIRNNLDYRGDNNILFVQYESEKENLWLDIDAKSFEFLSKFPFYYHAFEIIKQGFLIPNEKTLFLKDFDFNNIIWQKEFSENIEGEILTYKDKLLVSLSNGDFVCLEQETGQEVWRCKEVYGYHKIIKGQFSYQNRGRYFSIINLEQGKKICDINVEEFNRKEEIFPSSSDVLTKDDRLYFLSPGYSGKCPAVGSFNFITKTYDWIHRFEGFKDSYGGFSGTNCLQYHDGKLYVLTSDSVLHIFDEE